MILTLKDLLLQFGSSIIVQLCLRDEGHVILIVFVWLHFTSEGSGKESGKFSGRIIDSDMHDVGRFLNRLLGLPPDIQNRFWLFLLMIICAVHL